ncbi:MAG: glycosyltransferase family 39 protein [Nitrospirae bacterium]|nr:glycosyltransferase family 39 protein [Nitrospirota bacterium]
MKNRKTLYIALLIYTATGAALLPAFQYLINPDGISYLNIAGQYLKGNFGNAVNACCSPMYSWLIVPFLAAGAPPLLSARLASLAIGFVSVIGVALLAGRLELPRRVEDFITVASAPLSLVLAFDRSTPDHLVVCAVIFYLYLITDRTYAERYSNGVLCGVAGAAGYLCKSYLMPFFLVHFILANVYFYFRLPSRKMVLSNLLAGLAVFVIISGAWVAVLSYKYGGFTVGTAGGAVHALVGPGPDFDRHPVETLGLLRLPYDGATSAWDDPSYIKARNWSPFSSAENLRHQLFLVGRNLRAEARGFRHFTWFFPILIIAGFYYSIKEWREPGTHREAFLISTAAAVYCSGFLPLFVMRRYLWVMGVLLLLLCGYMLKHLFRSGPPVYRTAVAVLMLGSFLMPLRPFVMPPYKGYRRAVGGREVYESSMALRERLGGPGFRMASDDRWGMSLYHAYHLGAAYLGQVRESDPDPAILKSLAENRVEYFMVWDGGREYGFLAGMQVAARGSLQGHAFRIYRMDAG